MNKTRNMNIELLRNIAMLLIVLLHMFNKNKAIFALEKNTPVYYIAWVIYAVCQMGNNLFIIISGYFYKETRFKPEKLFTLCFLVWFYSVGLAFVAKVFLGLELTVGKRNILFPIIMGEYWFITCYIMLYCFMRYLKKFIESLSKETHLQILLLGFLFLSLIPTFMNKNFANTNEGHSLIWFLYLYLLGAYIRSDREKIANSVRGKSIGLCCLTIAIVPAYKFLIEGLRKVSIGHYIVDEWSESLFCINSPFILLASVFVFICFENMNSKSIRYTKIVNFFGSGCLGVYLIHNNRNISHYIWESLRIDYWLCERENVFFVLLIGGSVFIVCNLLDHIREWLFRVLYINRLIEKTSHIIAGYGNAIKKRIIKS